MVVDSILPHAESGPNDHRKDAHQFMSSNDENSHNIGYFDVFKLTSQFQKSDLPSENIHSKARRVIGRASAICKLFTYAEKFINIRANKRAKADNVNE